MQRYKSQNVFCVLLIVAVFLASAPAVFAASLGDLRAAVVQEDYKKAKSIAEGILASRGVSRAETSEAEYFLGLSQLRLGEYVRAEGTFKKLLSSRPGDDVYDKASVGHVDALYMQGYYEQALKEVNGLISRRKTSEMTSLFYLKAARASLKLARWSRAREMLEKIMAEYPDSFESTVAKQLLEERQYFTVQVGSFADKGRAEKLVKELTSRREYAYIVEAKAADGRAYYRVRVGQMSSLKDAQVLETKLSGLGYPTLIYP